MLSSVPSAIGPTAGATSVTLKRAKFAYGQVVPYGATTASSITFDSATQIAIPTPAASAGAVNVAAWPWPSSPTLSAISPASGPATGGTLVTLTGTGFLAGVTVTFGSAAATSVTVQSSNKITAITPASSAGTVNVVVTDPNGGSGTLTSGFTFQGAASVCGPPNYCARTDFNVQQISSTPNVGALVGANTIVTDPDFGSKIVRITDSQTEGEEGRNDNFMGDCGGSAESNVFDSSDGYLYVCDNGSAVHPMTWNPTTMQAASMYVSSYPSTNGLRLLTLRGPQFSFTIPGRLRGMDISSGNLDLVEYDLTSASPPSEVVDYNFSNSNCLPSTAGGSVEWVEVPTSSADDNTFMTAFSFSAEGGQNTGYYVVVWNRTNGCRWYNTKAGTVGGQWGITGSISISDTYLIHNVRISKDGNWAKITAEGCVGTCHADLPYIWDIATNAVSACSTSECGGHQAAGYTHMVNTLADVPQQMQLIHPLDSILTYSDLWSYPSQGPATNENWDNHLSWQNANSSDSNPYLYSSFTTNGTITDAWDDEVVGQSVDGSGKVWRFCHTFATTQDTANFPAQYAIGAVSQDGKFFMWSSDWSGQLGDCGSNISCTSGQSDTCVIGTNCRGDVFVVQLQ
jgi:hypothetical protein